MGTQYAQRSAWDDEPLGSQQATLAGPQQRDALRLAQQGASAKLLVYAADHCRMPKRRAIATRAPATSGRASTKPTASPVFPPHVTLCSEPAEIAPAGSALTLELPRVVTLATLSFGSDYFHGCYLELLHDAGVRSLQARCAAALRGTVPEKYPLHLSLSYGVLTSEQREAAVALAAPLPLSAELDHIEIWDTSGPVSSWHMQQKL